jgi:hypothetical protein
MVGRGSSQDSERRKKTLQHGTVIYTLWNIWKERNRRIFNNTHESAMQVALRVKEDIEQRKRALAWGGGNIMSQIL